MRGTFNKGEDGSRERKHLGVDEIGKERTSLLESSGDLPVGIPIELEDMTKMGQLLVHIVNIANTEGSQS